MNEKLNDFLTYGMDGKIEKTEIYKMDGVVLFITFLAFAVNEIYGGSLLGRIVCILFPLSFIIFTFLSKNDTNHQYWIIFGIYDVPFRNLKFG